MTVYYYINILYTLYTSASLKDNFYRSTGVLRKAQEHTST